jgi:hypothetical protein
MTSTTFINWISSITSRYLAKRFHPDYGPGQGIEKIVRNEIFKEIWNEIDRLDQGVSRSSSAA